MSTCKPKSIYIKMSHEAEKENQENEENEENECMFCFCSVNVKKKHIKCMTCDKNFIKNAIRLEKNNNKPMKCIH